MKVAKMILKRLLLRKGYFLLLLLFVLRSTGLWAQDKKVIHYNASAMDLKTLHQYDLPEYAIDSVSAAKALNELINALQYEGYLLSTVENIVSRKEHVEAFITVGKQYRWVNLTPGNVDEHILSSIGYRERRYRNKPFRYKEVAKLLESIITYSENHGFPFASVRLDSVSIKEAIIHAAINYKSGPFITFDTVALSGGTKTKPMFLSSYLRTKPGAPYDERKLAYALSRLRRLPYVKVNAPAYVTFQLKSGTPHFSLSDVKANQVDGIIGLLPNEGEDGKALITGQFDLLLQNMFGTGKKISLQWQRPEENSQTLDIQYAHPNVLRSPINFQGRFSLLKEDTLFLNRNLTLETALLMGEHSSIRLYTEFKVARMISTSGLESRDERAAYADFNLDQYGLGFNWNSLNDYLVPTRGLSFDVQGAVGNKKIKRNSDLDAAFYDSLDMNMVQYNFQGEFNYYYPVSKRIVLRSKVMGGFLRSDQLFVNDLYRLGGLNSIRGFIENSFYASDFVLGTLEAQLFLDSESYLFLFYDQGYIKTKVNDLIEDYPAGLGTGVTFTTNAGIFTFIYALGRTSAQPFNFNFSKIHFGYITRF